ncbi:hypothetical protein Bca4012_082897 [Brassica carinata]
MFSTITLVSINNMSKTKRNFLQDILNGSAFSKGTIQKKTTLRLFKGNHTKKTTLHSLISSLTQLRVSALGLLEKKSISFVRNKVSRRWFPVKASQGSAAPLRSCFP